MMICVLTVHVDIDERDFVIEALRSIAKLLTHGDQHDPSFFELVVAILDT